MERGGLLTWLEWLIGSCAIICGGALTAEIRRCTIDGSEDVGVQLINMKFTHDFQVS